MSLFFLSLIIVHKNEIEFVRIWIRPDLGKTCRVLFSQILQNGYTDISFSVIGHHYQIIWKSEWRETKQKKIKFHRIWTRFSVLKHLFVILPAPQGIIEQCGSDVINRQYPTHIWQYWSKYLLPKKSDKANRIIH